MKRHDRRIAFPPGFVVISLFLVAVSAELARASDLCDAITLARQYLQSKDSDEKASLSHKLAAYDQNWKDVIKALRFRPTQAVKPGYYEKEHFTQPQLRQKHPDDLLYLVVPTNYRAERPTGLVVFMHGGGKGSLRTTPDRYMRPADPDTPKTS